MDVFSSTVFDNMFHLKLSLVEKIARPILVYFAVIVLLRIFGKRELAQLNPFDLVVLLSVSNTVQNAIIGDDNSLIGGLVGATSLFAINYLTVRLLFKHRNWHEVLGGSPTKLIENGKLNQAGMAKELLTEAELTVVAHRQGFDDLNEVETCTLDPGGTFLMKGIKPGPEDLAQKALLSQLDEIKRQLDFLGTQLQKRVN
jgi:uncharacterized membrane protein YcaP (DUF421 family)